MLQPHLAQNRGGVERVAADFRGELYVFERGEVLHQIVKLKHKPHVVAAILRELAVVVSAYFIAV